ENLLKEREGYVKLDLLKCHSGKEWDDAVDKALKDGAGVVLVDHFEYDSFNSRTNRIKLVLLEKLACLPEKRVIIISSVPIQSFTGMNVALPAEEELEKEVNAHLQTRDRWSKTLGSFYDFWFPIKGVNNEGAPSMSRLVRSKNVPEEIRDVIVEECEHGFFLRKIGEDLCESMKDETLKRTDPRSVRFAREGIVLKVQQLAHSYYLAIWSLLTPEEQYVLFDIAQDGLVNLKNLEVVDLLVKKGLIVSGSSLQVMNRSFQNFILTVVEPADLMKIEYSTRESGAWNRFRKPLIIFVIALILFILKSDQNETFTWITGFAAGVPLVINLLAALMKGEIGKE
ncbi:MAG TPA: hypothetical protein VFU15_02390, partial [Bacteroidia bacterium]|nr:hypothetical protein [Bacteroidia bacterium]